MKQRLAKKVMSPKVRDYKPMILIPAPVKKPVVPPPFKYLKMEELIRIILAILISILTILFMTDLNHWRRLQSDEILKEAFGKSNK